MLNHIIYGKTAISIQAQLQSLSVEDKIKRFESELSQLPQISFNPRNIFRGGIYERRMSMPKDSVLVGAEHKTDYKATLISGTVAELTKEGVKIFTGPIELEAKIGTKRILYAMTDVEWMDEYENPDNCTNLEELIPRLANCNYADFVENRIIEDSKKDYPLLLENLGLTQEKMDEIVNKDNLIEMDDDFNERYELKESPIHGIGMFAKKDFKKGELLFPALMEGFRTDAGRFINHSPHYNVKFEPVFHTDLVVITTRRINAGEELLLDYRQAARVSLGKELL